jgi:hypothetical protein
VTAVRPPYAAENALEAGPDLLELGRRPPRSPSDIAWGLLIRWWVVAGCLLATVQLLAPDVKAELTNYHAATSVSENRVEVTRGPLPSGIRIRIVPASADWATSSISRSVAKAAAPTVGLSPDALLKGLRAKRLSQSTVELSYVGDGSEAGARSRLNAYVSALIAARRRVQRQTLVELAQASRAEQNFSAARRLQAAADAVDRRVARTSHARTWITRPVGDSVIEVAAWLLALVAAAGPLALLLRRDTRIRRLSEMERVGLPVRYVDAERRSSVRGLLAAMEHAPLPGEVVVLGRCGTFTSMLAPALAQEGLSPDAVIAADLSDLSQLHVGTSDVAAMVVTVMLGRTTWPELARSLRGLEARGLPAYAAVTVAVERRHRWRRASELLLGTGRASV